MDSWTFLLVVHLVASKDKALKLSGWFLEEAEAAALLPKVFRLWKVNCKEKEQPRRMVAHVQGGLRLCMFYFSQVTCCSNWVWLKTSLKQRSPPKSLKNIDTTTGFLLLPMFFWCHEAFLKKKTLKHVKTIKTTLSENPPNLMVTTSTPTAKTIKTSANAIKQLLLKPAKISLKTNKTHQNSK